MTPVRRYTVRRMARLPRPSLGSAHAVAVVALVVALGGGYGVAQSGSAPAPTKAYHLAADKPHLIKDGSATLVAQLVVPADGAYAATAKLDVSRRSSAKGGAVVCFLGAIGRQDRAHVSVAPGQSVNVSLSAVGRAAAPLTGGTQAADLSCQATGGAYTVSRVRMTAIALDAFKVE
jgi:hypothetical protein